MFQLHDARPDITSITLQDVKQCSICLCLILVLCSLYRTEERIVFGMLFEARCSTMSYGLQKLRKVFG